MTDARFASATTNQTPPPPDTAIPAEAASLVVVHSPDESATGRAIALATETLILGRDVDPPNIRLADARLSRIHFRIVYDGRSRAHQLGDARSRNGSFVDGARARSVPLRNGSTVRAGDTVFVYRTEDPVKKVSERITRLAASNLTVLVLGETGTGKERAARALHDRSGRKGPFVAINCAALPRELLAAELFGHTKGAFSGATAPRLGLFQAAESGTLFLDEIGDLSPDLQAVLLRSLQEGTVRPLGSDSEVRVDVRVVAATHRDLALAVRRERFRADLYSRIAQTIVQVPALRERRADVLSLAEEIAKNQGSGFAVTADAAEALVRYAWPFNIRELEGVVRAFVATEGNVQLGIPYLTEHHPDVIAALRPDGAGTVGNESVRPRERPGPHPVRERAAMERLLHRHGGNVSAAASELGKPRALVYRWIRAAGIDPARFRDGER
jgi:transcriptional regulator with GAF, ATPase, and Fis domain